MKRLYTFIIALTAAAWLSGCSDEQMGNPSVPGEGNTEAGRREVLLTLNNKLVPAANTTRADAGTPSNPAAPTTPPDETIATQAENTVAALDVYVFGCTTANGTYTYLERFAYRSEGNMPAGASPINLTVSGDKGEKLNAILNLQKGFFVRLYCLANQTELVDPATDAAVLDDAFTGITYTIDEHDHLTVADEGKPTEEEFKTFHSVLIDPADANAVINTPLPMAGALIVPLDLRSTSAATRLAAGFRLERPVARFDVRNNAETSHLQIQEISIANGRKGASFFPVQVYGTRPDAEPDDLITYPVRTFAVIDDINTGYQAGAFYSYPTLEGDATTMLIKGLYQVNKTEQKEVVYEVPFRQEDTTGNGFWLEIQPNHRYTVNITDAGEYELHFNLSIADWNDEGNIDDYHPDNTPGAFRVTIPDDFSSAATYVEADQTVTLGLNTGVNFNVVIKANAAIEASASYQGNVAGQEWLTIGPADVTPDISDDYKYSSQYTFNVKLNDNYTGGLYPVATLRFTNLASGNEQLLFVKLNGVPTVSAGGAVNLPAGTSASNQLNEYDPNAKSISLLRIPDSQIALKVSCPDGITIQVPTNQQSVFTVEEASQTNGEHILIVKLLTPEYAGDALSFSIHSAGNEDLKEEISLTLVDADVTADIATTVSGVNITPAHDTEKARVTVPLTEENITPDVQGKAPTVFTVATTAVKKPETVLFSFGNSSHWLDYEIVEPVSRALAPSGRTFRFFLKKDALAGATQATVTVVNGVSEGKNFEFIATPEVKESAVTLVTPNQPADNALDPVTKSLLLYKLGATGANSVATLQIVNLGGVESVTCSNADLLQIEKITQAGSPDKEQYKLTPLQVGTGTLTITSKASGAGGTPTSVDYAVTVKDASIGVTDPTQALTLNVEDQATANFVVSRAWKGCTIQMPTWDSANGQQWFSLSESTINPLGEGSTQTITLTLQEASLTAPSKENVKAVTLTLKNAIENGGDATVTVTPKWMAPSAMEGQESSFTLAKEESATIQVIAPIGGIAAKLTNDAVGTVAVNNNEITVTAATDAPGNTSCNIEVYNKQLSYENLTDEDKLIIPVRIKINAIVNGPTVTINGKVWAAGNIISDGNGGCKIGEPTDTGLFFRWGSLIGYDNKAVLRVKPSEYQADPSIFSSPYIGNNTMVENRAEGKGDPCHVYFGGNWRMPTVDEVRALGNLTNNETSFPASSFLVTEMGEGVKGYLLPQSGEPQIFFPIAGYMNSTIHTYYGSYGYYWTGSNNWIMYTGGSYINIETRDHNIPFPIRCIQGN